MNDRKERFISHIKGLIPNCELAVFAEDYLNSVPAPFWTAAASSSGLHHPQYALKDGGLVRHTLVNLYVALDLCNQYDIDLHYQQAVVLAVAGHDTYKGGEGDKWTETVRGHGQLAADKMWAMADKLALDPKNMHLIAIAGEAIEKHMTMWIDRDTPQLNIPVWNLGHPVCQVVAVADYIASRKYLVPADKLLELLTPFYSEEELKEEWRG